MPWISTAVAVGGNLLGGLFGDKSAKRAEEAAKRAAAQAAAASAKAKAEAMGINQGVYDTARSVGEDARTFGGVALADLAAQSRRGVPGVQRLSTVQNRNPADVMNDPGYRFGLEQGQSAIEGSAAARGGLYSGANLKALTQFGNDYATTKYGQAYDRLRNDGNDQFARDRSERNDVFDQTRANSSDQSNRYNALIGYGQQANSQLLNAGDNYASRNNQLVVGDGANQGNAAISKGNAAVGRINTQNELVNGAISGITGGLTDIFGKKKPSGFADGGRVKTNYRDGGRAEPKVGTRAPLPSGSTGGGLARAALLDPDATGEAATRSNTDAPMPVPRLLDRRMTLQKQMAEAGLEEKANGGRVGGEGKPRADDVPAMLSSNEHVLDVRTVRHVGKGNLEKGHNMLTRLRMQAKGAK